MHTITTGIKYTLLPPLVALSWLSVCLLVAGAGLFVFISRLAQSVLQTSQLIVRA